MTQTTSINRQLTHPTAFKNVFSFIKYCAVGLINTGLSYATYVVWVSVTSSQYVGVGLGYAIGMISSYWLNSRWTFERRRTSLKEALTFLAVNLGVLLISELGLWFITRNLISQRFIAQAINIVPTTIVGFFANRVLVFRARPVELDTPVNASSPTHVRSSL